MTAIIEATTVCDLPHDADAPTGITRAISVDGKDYEIDVCPGHGIDLDTDLAPFIKHARPARRWPKRNTAHRARTAAVRAWAKAQGIKISDRGRIPAEVTHQYKQATTDA